MVDFFLCHSLCSDMKMLDEYIHIWGARFQLESVPKNITDVLFPKQCTTTLIKWSAIPHLLHSPIRLETSSRLIPPMVTKSKEGLTMLKFSDITLSGIDFHCCNVLESILSDRVIFSNICDKVQKLEFDDSSMMPGDTSKLREHALKCLKKCMWKFSSSISNKRLLFSGVANVAVRQEELLYPLWEMVIPNIHAYASRYVEGRLVQ